MGEFAHHLHGCRKNGPQHSATMPAAICGNRFDGERIRSISLEEHLISDSLVMAWASWVMSPCRLFLLFVIEFSRFQTHYHMCET
jgi:hypothetical protein